MSGALVVARHALQESVRRRVLAVVLVLTLLFLAMFTFATIEVFHQIDSFAVGAGRGTLDARGFLSSTLLGLAMFATLFLGAVLAVFLTLGAVRGDAERGLLQPLVVRPVGRGALLLARFGAAAAVSALYVFLVYAISAVIVHTVGHRWPDRFLGPGLALSVGVMVIVALSLLGSVFLSATANGIAVFMVFGAGLVGGLMTTIAGAISNHNLANIAHGITLALPFEALYQAGLHALNANQRGFTGALIQLGPFGSSHAGGLGLDLWTVAYLVVVGAVALWAFGRRDL
jgi:ABC-type transport system involved in multi-copper enzyme maturation permease subunit